MTRIVEPIHRFFCGFFAFIFLGGLLADVCDGLSGRLHLAGGVQEQATPPSHGAQVPVGV